MPAYFESGFTVREPAWHGLGNVLDNYPDSWDDARFAAGLMWEPMLVPAYVKMPSPVAQPVTVCGSCGITAGSVNHEDQTFECVLCGASTPFVVSDFMALPEHRIVVRDDTNVPLGMVSDQFALVTHAQMGEIMQALHKADAKLKFESAGSIKGGAHVWSLAYLDEPVEVAGDNTASYPYLALTNAHDGTGACKVFFTTVRIVCWNTYSAAINDADRRKASFTFRHTGNMADKIEAAKLAINGMRDDHSEWVALADELYKIPVRDGDLAKYVFEFLPEPPADVISPRVRNNIDKARQTFTKLYNKSPTTDGHRGTALGLLDASVEYLDHLRGYQSRDTYMGRTMLRPEPMKAKALTLIRELVGADN